MFIHQACLESKVTSEDNGSEQRTQMQSGSRDAVFIYPLHICRPNDKSLILAKAVSKYLLYSVNVHLCSEAKNVLIA
jgi:hypothetical protein